MTSEDRIAEHEAAVEKAEAVIRSLLMRLTVREALIELVGDSTIAEFLAEKQNGDYHSALMEEALRRAETTPVSEPHPSQVG